MSVYAKESFFKLGHYQRLAKEDGRLPPYYWAAFVLSGDWR